MSENHELRQELQDIESRLQVASIHRHTEDSEYIRWWATWYKHDIELLFKLLKEKDG